MKDRCDARFVVPQAPRSPAQAIEHSPILSALSWTSRFRRLPRREACPTRWSYSFSLPVLAANSMEILGSRYEHLTTRAGSWAPPMGPAGAAKLSSRPVARICTRVAASGVRLLSSRSCGCSDLPRSLAGPACDLPSNEVRRDRHLAQNRINRVDIDGTGEEKSLSDIDVLGSKQASLAFVFDSLGNRLELEHLAELNECVDECCRFNGVGDP